MRCGTMWRSAWRTVATTANIVAEWILENFVGNFRVDIWFIKYQLKIIYNLSQQLLFRSDLKKYLKLRFWLVTCIVQTTADSFVPCMNFSNCVYVWLGSTAARLVSLPHWNPSTAIAAPNLLCSFCEMYVQQLLAQELMMSPSVYKTLTCPT